MGDSSTQGTQDRALVVDDYEDIRDLLAELLRRSGYEVETASSAFEALEKFNGAEESFCVIVCDIGMPKMNGYELARKLRAHPKCKTTVLIALTGFSIYDDRNRAVQAGFDDLLVKPIGHHSLLALIERLRKNKR